MLLLYITNLIIAFKNELRIFWKQAAMGSNPGSTISYLYDLEQVHSYTQALVPNL